MRKADNLPPFCAVVTKSGNLNFLEAPGPLRACNGTALPFTVRTEHQTHATSVTKISHLTLYCVVMALCSEIHIKHTNTPFGHNIHKLFLIPDMAVHIVTTRTAFSKLVPSKTIFNLVNILRTNMFCGQSFIQHTSALQYLLATK